MLPIEETILTTLSQHAPSRHKVGRLSHVGERSETDFTRIAGRHKTPCVLMVVPALDRPGGVSQLYQVLRAHLGPQVEYFSLGSRAEGENLIFTLWRLIKDYGQFIHVLLTGQHDIVHLNPSLIAHATIRDGVLLLISKLLRKQVLVFFHGWNISFEKFLGKYFLWLFRLVYFKADTALVLASEFKDKLVVMGYTKRIFLGATAIDDETFSCADVTLVSRRVIRSQETFTILFLSRIVKEKGVYEAIDTYQRVRSRHPHVKLTVAGDGPDLSSVKVYVRDRNIPDVSFPGFVRGKSKASVFKQADVYLFPTYGEGMPISLLEAMAYGLPVITRPVGAMRDFFEEGKMGMLVESLNPLDYANALELLLANRALRLKIGLYNLDYARKTFQAQDVARNMLQLYQDISLKCTL